jgi:hypothetical protein
MNRDAYNYYAQVDKTNISVDPQYLPGGGMLKAPDFFSSPATVLKGRGRDGKTIGLISEAEMIRRGQDADNDGVPDDKDKCPSLQEDRDGFQDDDGCPDFDNDNDGLYDTHDKCPDQAEDADGFEDKDGCPDFDNDRDGFADSVDVCPGNAETRNNYKDDDGCPDEVPAGGAKESGKVQSEPKPATAETGKKAVPAPPATDTAKKPAAKKSR